MTFQGTALSYWISSYKKINNLSIWKSRLIQFLFNITTNTKLNIVSYYHLSFKQTNTVRDSFWYILLWEQRLRLVSILWIVILHKPDFTAKKEQKTKDDQKVSKLTEHHQLPILLLSPIQLHFTPNLKFVILRLEN